MHQHPLSLAVVSRPHSNSFMPTTCSTKLPIEPTGEDSSLRRLKRSSGMIPTGPRVESKKELSRILRTDAAIKGIEKKANSDKYNTLWPKAVLEALDEAVRENRWQSALKIFRLLRKQHWYEPRCRTYTKLFKVLGNCRQPEQASLLFQVMLSEGLKPTIDVYTSLIGVYGKSKLLDKAFATLEDMKSICDCKPDVYTFTVLISCCCRHGRFDLIKSILLEMSYLGIVCNTVTYNTIIDGYGKAGMFEEMGNVLIDMIEKEDSLPDIFTFNSIIGAYGNGGMIEKMEKWYDRFQLMGVQPDITTFNILILSYGKAGMHNKMGSVMDFMKKRFFSPDIVTYNIMIETFGKAGEVEEMDKWFRKMKYQGIKPNSITYCSIVNGYSKAGLVLKIDSVLRQIVNSDVILDTPFFNCIINAYGQAGDLATMKELFMQMEERKCNPDKITFSTMIKIYANHGLEDAVQELEKLMIATARNSDSDKRFIGC
ncbi:PREDICTED: pentatricopeptide repeat-containing protein At3g53170 [Tarenaya hassleriana]|uniref:pentatricopeptide repeat-containing protein At3g53170 n=1 Tax=Tarenaya hassleriana TaxID=28532 RepID=UPI00053C8E9F|nr:PREDICTED: pentatricopeptide repeat-containing protein At3g53170 [Tarenaya hassleriana]XP_010557800.1 PREDICTED: pentatricopeptide repeat-containing protein At3g53170 [Tarenaya hassleriana]